MDIQQTTVIQIKEKVTATAIIEVSRITKSSYQILCSSAERAVIATFLLKECSLKRSEGFFGVQHDWLDGMEGERYFINLNQKAFRLVYPLCVKSGWLK